MFTQQSKILGINDRSKKGALTSQGSFGTFFGPSKKGVAEVTTFVLLTLLIVVSSIVSYTFSRSILDERVAKIDLDNFDSYMKKMSIKISQIQNFDDSSVGLEISFNKGELNFEDNRIYYTSLVEYVGNNYCFDDICVENINGYERIYTNLSNSYIFRDNLSLIPGSYLLLFKNYKNESKISVTFK